jgi:hypothetical protein
MTQTKGHKRVNLHLALSTHTKLRAWCIRNGTTLQDGLHSIVDAAVGGSYRPPIDASGYTRQTAAQPAPTQYHHYRSPDPLPWATREEAKIGGSPPDANGAP